jgi:hypothetical protein
VMDLAQYEFLRECEIIAAWTQTRGDVPPGRYRKEDADAHMTRIKGELADAL